MNVSYEELARRYGIRSMSTNYSDDEVEISMSSSGATQLFNDYQAVSAAEAFRDGSIEPLNASDSEYVVLRFDVRKVDLETALQWGQAWERMLPDKTILLIPNEMHVECWGKERLEQFKNYLEETIHDLSFDNLVGF